MDQRAVVVVLLHDEGGQVHPVHPLGHVLIGVVGALAGDRVHQHSAADVGAAEQADGLDHTGADPPGVALFVDFKRGSSKHVGGVVEAEMAVHVAVEGLRGGVLHTLALGQTDHLHLLGHHVHHDVGGQALGAVGEPLDEVGVLQGCHTDRTALVVDLGGVVGHLELAGHVGDSAHLGGAQVAGGVLVQHGDLIKGDLLHVGDKVALLDVQQLPVGGGAEDGQGDDLTHQAHHNQQPQQDADGQALLLDEAEVLLHLAALSGGDCACSGGHRGALQVEAAGDEGADDVHHAQQAHEGIEVLGLEVEGREGEVEVDKADDCGDHKVQQHFAHFAFGSVELLSALRFLLIQFRILLFSKCAVQAARLAELYLV